VYRNDLFNHTAEFYSENCCLLAGLRINCLTRETEGLEGDSPIAHAEELILVGSRFVLSLGRLGRKYCQFLVC